MDLLKSLQGHEKETNKKQAVPEKGKARTYIGHAVNGAWEGMHCGGSLLLLMLNMSFDLFQWNGVRSGGRTCSGY